MDEQWRDEERGDYIGRKLTSLVEFMGWTLFPFQKKMTMMMIIHLHPLPKTQILIIHFYYFQCGVAAAAAAESESLKWIQKTH